MRMGLATGALALLIVMGAAPADAKAPKNGKIRAEAMLGDDGPRLHDFVEWRAVPIVEGAMPVPAEPTPVPVDEEAPEGDGPPADGEAPADDDAPEDDASEPEEPPGPPAIELGGGKLNGELPPGRYLLQAEIAPVVMSKEIEIRSRKRTNLEYVFEGAFVEYAPKNAPSTFECGSTNGKETRSFTADKPTQRFFPPGIWEVTCKRGVLSTASVIKLNSGNMLKITPDLSTGELTANLVGDEYPDKVYFEVRDVEGTGPKAEPVAVYAEATKAPISVEVPPGTYEIFAKMAYTRPVPDRIAITGSARSAVDEGKTVVLDIDIPWALVLPKLEIGKRARTPGETRWFVRNPAEEDTAQLAIRLQPQGVPFTIYAYEEPIVVEVHDEYDRVVGVSAPFVPEKHTTTEIPIKVR